jgi:excisionase family DNA binding protein
MEGEDYTVQDAARFLRTTERTIRRRLERGDLEGSRPGALQIRRW